MIQLNKVVYRARKQKVSITFPKLDLESIEMKVFADASFNNLPNGGSQGGHIIFICDKNNNSCPLSWSSTKIKRVVRSTLAAEAIALNNACDNAMYLSNLVKNLSGEKESKLPITAFTDSKSTLDAIHSSTSVSDKKLRLEIAVLREYQ